MHRVGYVTVAVLLAAMPLVSADAGRFENGRLEYGLTDQPGRPVAAHELIMRAEAIGQGGSGPIEVAESVTWIGQQPFPIEVDVAEQQVELHLRFLARTNVESVTVCAGVAGPAGFTSHGCTTQHGGPDLEEVVAFGVPVEAHVIEAGQRPAVELSVDLLGTSTSTGTASGADTGTGTAGGVGTGTGTTSGTGAGTGLALVETGPSAAFHYTACLPPETLPAEESCPDGG